MSAATLAAAAALVVLLSGTQVAGILRNRRRTRTLERRVDERTAALRARERWFRAVVEASAGAVLVIDEGGLLACASPSAERLLGVHDAQTAAALFARLEATERAALEAGYRRCRTEGGAVVLASLPRGGPDRRAYRVTLRNLAASSEVRGVVLTATEVTGASELDRQLAGRALRDPLTGLANRALFSDRLGNAVARHARPGPSMAVVCLGLDGVEMVSETLGRSAADALLQEAGRRVAGAVRGGDTVGRLDRDEFGVIIEDPVGEDDAHLTAERIALAVSEPCIVEGHPLAVSCSAGVALLDTADLSAEEVLRRAGVALSAARIRREPGTVQVYDTALQQALRARLTSQGELSAAIGRDQLRLHYQPVLDLQSEEVRGVEALVRWEHPTRGVVGPAEFIPVAEESGLVAEIGRWVLERACRDIAAVNRELPPERRLSVNVNVSARQLGRDTLADEIEGALLISGLAPSALVVELTESAFIGEVDATRRRLEALKRLGIRVAVDDFGAGFATLSYLKDLPVDVVKIDRSFIVDLHRDPSSATLARGIIRLSRELGLETVAEGVEQPEEAALLRGMRCDKVQGFLYARPMPLDSLRRYLRASAEPALIAGAS